MFRSTDDKVYAELLKFAGEHYENFPVVSVMVKKELRRHVAAVYWFARSADDIADEGNYNPEVRLQKLQAFEIEFLNAMKGNYSNEYWPALHNTVVERQLSVELFLDLLKAFKQDTIKIRYSDIDELLGYCRNSANPVGRLILQLYNYRDEKLYEYSDHICSALQITNFLQDISVDYKKNRIYIPIKDIEYYGLNEQDFLRMTASGRINGDFRRLIEFYVKKTGKMFDYGSKLTHSLKGLLKIEIRWTVNGGMAILKKIEKLNYDTVSQRPVLSKGDLMGLMLRSLF